MSTQNANNVTITGGAISGASGSFTTLTASANVNFDSGVLFVDSVGNSVGVGTTSPSAKFQVNSGSSVIANLIGNNANNYIQISDNNGSNLCSVGSIAGGNWYLYTAGYGALYTGGTERMRITSTGGVSFGATGTAYGTSGQVLTSAGNAPPTWSSSVANATTATNIAGGAAGGIPYQTAANTTAILATGTGVLVGGTTPAYSTTPTLTGTNFSGIPNGATTASSANGASTIVSRDAAGSFTGYIITATAFASTGARSVFTAASEPFAVGSRFSSAGGYVYFGATDATATPGIQLSLATGTAGLTITSAGAATFNGSVAATSGSFSGQVSVPQSAAVASGGINLNAAGNGYLRGTANDGNSSTVANVQLMSWDGIGFSPSIGGQAVPSGENAVWIGTRTGTLNARSTIIGASFTGAGTGLTGTASGLSIGGNAGTVTNGLYTTGSQTVSNRNVQQGSQTATLLTATGSLGGLELQSAGVSGAAFMAFHRPAAFAAYFGLDTDNQFAVGGWSYGAALGNMKVGSLGVGTTASGTAGTVTATQFVASSDERLKTNWAGLDLDFVSRLANVKSGTFERISNGSRDVGVGAQSLQKLIPEAVVEDSEGMLSVNYGGAALVAAIELAKVVEELRAEVKELKAKLANGA
jgi:hypothetical protein